MNDAKGPTPGPWTWEDTLRGGDGGRILLGGDDSGVYCPDECDRGLIGASPRLLAACAACTIIAGELATMDLPADALHLVQNQISILRSASVAARGGTP